MQGEISGPLAQRLQPRLVVRHRDRRHDPGVRRGARERAPTRSRCSASRSFGLVGLAAALLLPSTGRSRRSGRSGADRPAGGHPRLGQRRPAEGRGVAREDRLHRRLQGSGDGPRRVRRLNVDGDGQGDLAGHGGEQRAVFVYQIDSYRYWERELGRSDFVYGQFGENFTVEGLGDDEVCIGDRCRIGTRGLRGHPAPRHVLPRRHPHGRPAHPRPARLAPPAGLLPPRAAGGRRARRGTRSSSSPPAPRG